EACRHIESNKSWLCALPTRRCCGQKKPPKPRVSEQKALSIVHKTSCAQNFLESYKACSVDVRTADLDVAFEVPFGDGSFNTKLRQRSTPRTITRLKRARSTRNYCQRTHGSMRHPEFVAH